MLLRLEIVRRKCSISDEIWEENGWQCFASWPGNMGLSMKAEAESTGELRVKRFENLSVDYPSDPLQYSRYLFDFVAESDGCKSKPARYFLAEVGFHEIQQYYCHIEDWLGRSGYCIGVRFGHYHWISYEV